MNELAIVILNYNGAKYLKKFLPSVINFSRGCRIVVADNFSTDNSLDLMEQEFPEIEVLKLQENHGFSEGYNIALKQIDSPYYVLLNSDVEVSENWWIAPLDLLKSSEDIAAVQPKILSYHEKEKFEYAGAGGGYIDKLGYPFCRGRIFLSIEQDEHQYDDERQVFWASGACMFIKSALYHATGGLDSEFFAHMEEIDLCWRLQKAGYRIMYCGKTYVYHVGGGTLEKSHPRKTYLNFRNGLSLLYKNYTRKELLTLLPIRLFLDWVAAIKFSLFDSHRHGYAVLRAHKFFFKNLRRNRKKRKETRRLGNAYPTTIYRGSIVFDHYIKRKKKFSSLDLTRDQ